MTMTGGWPQRQRRKLRPIKMASEKEILVRCLIRKGDALARIAWSQANGYEGREAKRVLADAEADIAFTARLAGEYTPEDIATYVKPYVDDLRRKIEFRKVNGEPIDRHEFKLNAILERFPDVEPADTPIFEVPETDSPTEAGGLVVEIYRGGWRPVDLDDVLALHDQGYIGNLSLRVVGFESDQERDVFTQSAPKSLRMRLGEIEIGRNFTKHSGERNETGVKRIKMLARHVAAFGKIRTKSARTLIRDTQAERQKAREEGWDLI